MLTKRSFRWKKYLQSFTHYVWCIWFALILTHPFFFQALRLSVYRGHIQHECAHSLTMTVAKLKLNIALTNDTPYLALTSELWVVFRELLKKNDRHISIVNYSWQTLKDLPITRCKDYYYLLCSLQWRHMDAMHIKLAVIRLFVQQLIQVNMKYDHKALHYLSFLRIIHRWSTNSLTKGE